MFSTQVFSDFLHGNSLETEVFFIFPYRNTLSGIFVVHFSE
ncbi:hypothetical protein [Capnocytophaga canimorsus]|nr:hypothetical protein [Capnocytophaga canimorsus]